MSGNEKLKKSGFTVKKKKRKKWYLLYFLLFIISLICLIVATDCGPCISKKDYEFVALLKEHLKRKGDMVDISEIHPGDWKRVCAFDGGYNANLALYTDSEDGNKKRWRKIVGNSRPYISDKYNETAISFYYDENVVEIFRMTPNHILFLGAGENHVCLEKNGAKFVVVGDTTLMTSEAFEVTNKSKDFIKIKLLSTEKMK